MKSVKKLSMQFILLLFCITTFAQGSYNKDVFSKKYIKDKIEKVSLWQLNNPSERDMRHWTNATFYSGLFSAWQTTKNKSLYQALMGMGDSQNWKPYNRWFHADDIAICQTYLDLYHKEKKIAMIQPTIDVINKFVAKPYPSKKDIEKIKLWWCDALFMVPPVFVKLTKETGDKSYLAFNDIYYKECYDLLYNKEESLFARDLNYVIKEDGSTRREKNGELIFWSRGNGWVMGGLALVLTDLPSTYKERPFYEQLFKEIAARIAKLQPEDGLWRTSLLDTESYSNGEVSGSAFFCYALAWGINNGLLDESYLPVVKKSWIALIQCVNDEGRVGWVQPITDSPQAKFSADSSSESYGPGAFLLAASEVIKLKK